MDKLKLPTLLVISDNPSVRFRIKKHLGDEFFILEALDASTAVNAVKTSSLDFIIIDSEVETANPLKLCTELKQNLNSFIPILFITGRLKKSFLNAALEAGVTDFINGQLNPEELHFRIAAGRKSQSIQERTKGASAAISQKTANLPDHYLKNKFLLHDQALRLIAHAKQNKLSLFGLFVRIDHFEEMQKTLGFLVTSEILLPLSQLVMELLNKSDLLIPTGEGAFILLLQGATRDRARTIAEELRSKIKQTLFSTKEGPIHLSISITLSSMEASEGDFNRMVAVSVQALKETNTATNLIISIEHE